MEGKIYYLKTNEHGEIECFDEEEMIEDIYSQLYCINERISDIIGRLDTTYDDSNSEDEIKF